MIKLFEKYAKVCVVDIETLSTDVNARICSIGAVVVDLTVDEPSINDTF